VADNLNPLLQSLTGAAGLIDMSYTIENLSAGTGYFTDREAESMTMGC